MADTLKDDLLPLIDELRGLPGELGFRPFGVSVRVVTWTGARVGQGSSTTTETQLFVGSQQNPKVVPVHRKDVTVGSEKVDALYDIGPLTPSFAGGGIEESVLRPPIDQPNIEVFYVLKGKGMPSTGLLCKRVADQTDRSLRNLVRVQSLGRAA